jgi:hypothetical protein
MYKVLHLSSRQEINLLDRRWRDQIEYLRTLDRRDLLACPGCEQPVRVRAGRFRRWHFAHKHLQNCPFERASLELLAARAMLYERLADQFGSQAVVIEKWIELPGLPRPFDAWVEAGGRAFAYWIFDRRLPPDQRADLNTAFQEAGARVNGLFVSEMLHPEQGLIGNRLYLTTTERAFIDQSSFDPAWQRHADELGAHCITWMQRVLP